MSYGPLAVLPRLRADRRLRSPWWPQVAGGGLRWVGRPVDCRTRRSRVVRRVGIHLNCHYARRVGDRAPLKWSDYDRDRGSGAAGEGAEAADDGVVCLNVHAPWASRDERRAVRQVVSEGNPRGWIGAAVGDGDRVREVLSHRHRVRRVGLRDIEFSSLKLIGRSRSPVYRAWRPTKSMNSVATPRGARTGGAYGGQRYEWRDPETAPFGDVSRRDPRGNRRPARRPSMVARLQAPGARHS